jgi:hypothetical protein
MGLFRRFVVAVERYVELMAVEHDEQRAARHSEQESTHEYMTFMNAVLESQRRVHVRLQEHNDRCEEAHKRMAQQMPQGVM